MKFFNKQRFKLIKGNGLKKYVGYAIGEIILVVIGILIALWINNWKQTQDANKRHKEIALRVLAQLDKDILKVKDYRSNLYGLEQTFLSYFDKEYDEKVVNDSKVIQLLFSINTLEMNDRVSILIDNAELNGSDYEEMLMEINGMYKDYIPNLEKMEAVIIDSVRENIDYVRNNTTWYTDFIVNLTCADKCYDFLMNDEQYRGRIASLKFLYGNGYGTIVKTFEQALLDQKAALSAQLLEM